MNKNVAIAIAVILILLVGGWFLMRTKQQVTPVTSDIPVSTPAAAESTSPAASEGAAMSKNETSVKISSDGFFPKSITIKVGDTVTWMNKDTADHQVSSDPHPTHTLFPILNKIGLIKAGDKKSLQFTTAGTFTYHDHLNPSLTGSVTVQ